MEKIEIGMFTTSFLIYRPRTENQNQLKTWHSLKYLLEGKNILLNTYATLPQKYIKKIKLHA